jgi:alkaline phosphatase D
VAFDFVTGSLTADPDPCTLVPDLTLIRLGEELIKFQNRPYMKLIDLVEQGYALVDITPEEAIVEFRGIDSLDPDATPQTFAKFRIVSGSSELEVLVDQDGPHSCTG